MEPFVTVMFTECGIQVQKARSTLTMSFQVGRDAAEAVVAVIDVYLLFYY